jgi:hypothetical protein
MGFGSSDESPKAKEACEPVSIIAKVGRGRHPRFAREQTYVAEDRIALRQ